MRDDLVTGIQTCALPIWTGPGAIEVFDLTLNNSGGNWTWTFTDLAPVIHISGDGENTTSGPTTLDLSGLVEAVDFDGDPVTLGAGDLLVTIVDDVPLMGTIENAAMPRDRKRGV